MLPVFICEDNRMQRERLTKYIEDYIMVEHFDMKLELSTGDPFELVSRMPTHQGMGL
ncbi:DNA-binding response regulator, partial [Listeria monocytogenes]|nr:DNA-binding response regulator [Listeria monocytogenes]